MASGWCMVFRNISPDGRALICQLRAFAGGVWSTDVAKGVDGIVGP